VREGRLRVIREEDRVQVYGMKGNKKIAEVRRLTSLRDL